ncbi:MAG TPA: energy transducer TonB [Burkholderiaceae bacterium]|jgi:TonB family protein
MKRLNRFNRVLSCSYRSAISMLSALLLAASVTSQASASPGSELARREFDRGNYAAALQKTQPLADSGDAAAQSLLGLMYADGKGVDRDALQAYAWYWKAASGGNIEAQLALVAIYNEGRGVAADPAMANYWQWKAADAYLQVEKRKLDTEIAQRTNPHVDKNNGPATINLANCKMPPYRQTGYGYHLSGTVHLLFLLSADGSVLETSMLQGSSWAALDHSILDSFAKTCTFTPARKDGKTTTSLYSLETSWAVEP